MHAYDYSPLSGHEAHWTYVLLSVGASIAIAAGLLYLARAWYRRASGNAITRGDRSHRLGVLSDFFWTIVAVGFGLIFLFLLRFTHERSEQYSDALAQGRCETVHGMVHVLNRESYYGHTPKEQIRVGDETLSFSHFEDMPGYHDTLAYTGVLSEGVCVDLCVFRGRILRVDMSADCSR